MGPLERSHVISAFRSLCFTPNSSGAGTAPIFAQNTSSVLSPLFTARPTLCCLTAVSLCVSTSAYLFFLGGRGEGGGRSSRAPLHFLSPFPLLSASAPRLPCSYRRQCRITVRELTVTGSPTAPAASPLLPQSSGPGTGIS